MASICYVVKFFFRTIWSESHKWREKRETIKLPFFMIVLGSHNTYHWLFYLFGNYFSVEESLAYLVLVFPLSSDVLKSKCAGADSKNPLSSVCGHCLWWSFKTQMPKTIFFLENKPENPFQNNELVIWKEKNVIFIWFL